MDQDKRKLLSALCHISGLCSPAIVTIGVPIAALCLTDDPVVRVNAKESINFTISVWLYGIVFGILVFLVIGIPLLFILIIVAFLMPIIATVSVLANPDKPYRYSFIIRFV